MFGKIGTTELILILAVVLLIFGPSRLPALGRMVGGAFGKLRKRTQEWDEDEVEAEEKSEAAPPAEAEAPAEEESVEE